MRDSSNFIKYRLVLKDLTIQTGNKHISNSVQTLSFFEKQE